MAVVPVTKYQTTSGEVFDTIEEANRAERKGGLAQWYEEKPLNVYGNCDDRDYLNFSTLYDWLWDNRALVEEMLK